MSPAVVTEKDHPLLGDLLSEQDLSAYKCIIRDLLDLCPALDNVFSLVCHGLV